MCSGRGAGHHRHAQCHPVRCPGRSLPDLELLPVRVRHAEGQVVQRLEAGEVDRLAHELGEHATAPHTDRQQLLEEGGGRPLGVHVEQPHEVHGVSARMGGGQQRSGYVAVYPGSLHQLRGGASKGWSSISFARHQPRCRCAVPVVARRLCLHGLLECLDGRAGVWGIKQGQQHRPQQRLHRVAHRGGHQLSGGRVVGAEVREAVLPGCQCGAEAVRLHATLQVVVVVQQPLPRPHHAAQVFNVGPAHAHVGVPHEVNVHHGHCHAGLGLRGQLQEGEVPVPGRLQEGALQVAGPQQAVQEGALALDGS
mmetsp:Transcript_35703/g.79420  ORF Transcript_35703/g.79420 Transcript_35703/m.79420 type:complete len:309 (-) Transcript_35703:671-1597(-)